MILQLITQKKVSRDWPGIWFGSGVAKHELTEKELSEAKHFSDIKLKNQL